MKRFQRPIVVALATSLATAGVALVAVTPASAAVLGTVTISPASGTDSTLFGGSVAASCPGSTGDSYWSIDGADLPADQAILAPGNSTGTGPQSFSGASIANLKSANAGSFSASGPYYVRFNCVDGATGAVSDTYTSQLNYTAGSGGSYTVVVPPRATSTILTASPAGPFELGTLTDLTANVTPSTGSDDFGTPAMGSVEFFRGAVSLGVDNTLTTDGLATLDGVSLPQGSNSLTAVYSPGAGNFTGSTSDAVVVSVTPVADRPTSSTLVVTPVDGAPYQAVTLTCTVASQTTGQPNGTARFKDGSTVLSSVSVVNGAPVSITRSSFGPGGHTFACEFVGSAPYTDSTSAPVTATYVATGPQPSVDDQTVEVTIPEGAIVITTPYTPASPLTLGTALLDQSDSTYSAGAVFGNLDPAGDGLEGAAGDGPDVPSGINVTDTRAGEPGWSATLVAGDFTSPAGGLFEGNYAGLTAVTAWQLPGNAMQAADVVEYQNAPGTPAAGTGLGVPRTFASYPAAANLGSVNLTGFFSLDQVPTSVTPGLYTSTVTFTAV